MSLKILAFEQVVMRDIMNLIARGRYVKYNISKAERDALYTLRANKDIVIKSADKGGAIVVQNIEDYKEEIVIQLGEIVVETEAYIRDTMDTIRLIDDLEFDCENQFLVTMDIVSLYTNIPQQQALQTMIEFLQRGRGSHWSQFGLHIPRIPLYAMVATYP
ncbi:hypothetical protein NDU88_006309 [Pleurodeles waltl]|uniref:Reverse transcriptase domain-containing protein n=1 Tax=Pleurodeles waltl TaxID=8319 RepID=A0AAV7NU14_PLEWA|nr:hypothetical protein NDU88_006309 [Pleurodeles waltl]